MNIVNKNKYNLEGGQHMYNIIMNRNKNIIFPYIYYQGNAIATINNRHNIVAIIILL